MGNIFREALRKMSRKIGKDNIPYEKLNKDWEILKEFWDQEIEVNVPDMAPFEKVYGEQVGNYKEWTNAIKAKWGDCLKDMGAIQDAMSALAKERDRVKGPKAVKEYRKSKENVSLQIQKVSASLMLILEKKDELEANMNKFIKEETRKQVEEWEKIGDLVDKLGDLKRFGATEKLIPRLQSHPQTKKITSKEQVLTLDEKNKIIRILKAANEVKESEDKGKISSEKTSAGIAAESLPIKAIEKKDCLSLKKEAEVLGRILYWMAEKNIVYSNLIEKRYERLEKDKITKDVNKLPENAKADLKWIKGLAEANKGLEIIEVVKVSDYRKKELPHFIKEFDTSPRDVTKLGKKLGELRKDIKDSIEKEVNALKEKNKALEDAAKAKGDKEGENQAKIKKDEKDRKANERKEKMILESNQETLDKIKKVKEKLEGFENNKVVGSDTVKEINKKFEEWEKACKTKEKDKDAATGVNNVETCLDYYLQSVCLGKIVAVLNTTNVAENVKLEDRLYGFEPIDVECLGKSENKKLKKIQVEMSNFLLKATGYKDLTIKVNAKQSALDTIRSTKWDALLKDWNPKGYKDKVKTLQETAKGLIEAATKVLKDADKKAKEAAKKPGFISRIFGRSNKNKDAKEDQSAKK